MREETHKKLTNQDAYSMLTGEEKTIYMAYVMASEEITNRTTFYNRLRNALTVNHLVFLNKYFGFIHDRETGELTRVQNRKNYEELKNQVIKDGQIRIKTNPSSCSRPRRVSTISN